MLLAAIIIWGIISNSLADEDPTWKVDKKIQQYGEDVTLLCVVSNCCNKSAGWGKYTSTNEFNTIFIDVKDLNVDGDSKYDGGLNKTGFFLIIRNITRNDLNVSYSCTYGFLVSRKMLLLETNAFYGKKENKPDIRNRDKNSNNQDNSSISVYVAVGICVGVAGLASIIIYVIYRKGLFPIICLFINICSNAIIETEKASFRPKDIELSEGSSESLIIKERQSSKVNNEAHTVKQGVKKSVLICDQCEGSFKSMRGLKQHILKSHRYSTKNTNDSPILPIDEDDSAKAELGKKEKSTTDEDELQNIVASISNEGGESVVDKRLLPDSGATVLRTDSNCSYKSALNTLDVKRSSKSLINKERQSMRVNNEAHTDKQGSSESLIDDEWSSAVMNCVRKQCRQGLLPASGAIVQRTDSNCSYKSALNTLDDKRLLPASGAIVQRTDSNCSYKSALNTLDDKRVMRNASTCSNVSALSYKTCINGDE